MGVCPWQSTQSVLREMSEIQTKLDSCFTKVLTSVHSKLGLQRRVSMII